MGRLRIFAIVGVLAIPASESVQAADMPRLPSFPLPLPEKSRPIEEFVSGWYIRGDLGYRFQKVDSATHISGLDPATNTIDDVVIGGAGFGYKTKWFRLDLTADYGSRADYTGTTAGGASSYSATVDGYTVMFNGYLDLGTWYGFTPYVGGGVGTAYLSASKYETAPVPVTSTESQSNWNFAWAAMAGVSYRLMHNLLLDVSYRHIELGDVYAGPDPGHLKINGISGDEVRVGIRYLLD